MNKLLQAALILFVVGVIRAEEFTFDEDEDAEEIMPFEGEDLEEMFDTEVRMFPFWCSWCKLAYIYSVFFKLRQIGLNVRKKQVDNSKNLGAVDLN